MTTIVTVKACSWPVQVTTVDRFERDQSSAGVAQRLISETTTTETVEPFTSRDFYITNSRSIAFDELPAPPAEGGAG